jgi:nitrate reductase gamma subunit
MSPFIRALPCAVLLCLLAAAPVVAGQQDAVSGASKKTEAPAAVSAASGSEEAPAATSSASAAEKPEATSGASSEKAAPKAASKAAAPRKRVNTANFFRFTLADLSRGPLFLAAWVLFALGFAWRIRQFVRLTRRTRAPGMALAPPVKPDEPALAQGRSIIGRVVLRYRRWERASIFATHPVMGRVSTLFHLVLFLLPLLLPAHNILFYQTFRVALPTIAEPIMDVATVVIFVFCGFFFLRRIFVRRVRALTTLRDYLVLLLVAAPFVSAYLAHHHVLDYRTMLMIHMLVGDLVIALVPFTKLGHMPFIILNRFFTAGEYAWRPGNRRWQAKS